MSVLHHLVMIDVLQLIYFLILRYNKFIFLTLLDEFSGFGQHQIHYDSARVARSPVLVEDCS